MSETPEIRELGIATPDRQISPLKRRHLGEADGAERARRIKVDANGEDDTPRPESTSATSQELGERRLGDSDGDGQARRGRVERSSRQDELPSLDITFETAPAEHASGSDEISRSPAPLSSRGFGTSVVTAVNQQCEHCDLTKPLSEFISRNAHHGYTKWCEACREVYRRLNKASRDAKKTTPKKVDGQQKRGGCAGHFAHHREEFGDQDDEETLIKHEPATSKSPTAARAELSERCLEDSGGNGQVRSGTTEHDGDDEIPCSKSPSAKSVAIVPTSQNLSENRDERPGHNDWWRLGLNRRTTPDQSIEEHDVESAGDQQNLELSDDQDTAELAAAEPGTFRQCDSCLTSKCISDFIPNETRGNQGKGLPTLECFQCRTLRKHKDSERFAKKQAAKREAEKQQADLFRQSHTDGNHYIPALRGSRNTSTEDLMPRTEVGRRQFSYQEGEEARGAERVHEAGCKAVLPPTDSSDQDQHEPADLLNSDQESNSEPTHRHKNGTASMRQCAGCMKIKSLSAFRDRRSAITTPTQKCDTCRASDMSYWHRKGKSNAQKPGGSNDKRRWSKQSIRNAQSPTGRIVKRRGGGRSYRNDQESDQDDEEIIEGGRIKDEPTVSSSLQTQRPQLQRPQLEPSHIQDTQTQRSRAQLPQNQNAEDPQACLTPRPDSHDPDYVEVVVDTPHVAAPTLTSEPSTTFASTRTGKMLQDEINRTNSQMQNAKRESDDQHRAAREGYMRARIEWLTANTNKTRVDFDITRDGVALRTAIDGMEVDMAADMERNTARLRKSQNQYDDAATEWEVAR